MNCVKRSTTHSELFGPTRSDVTHEDLSLCNEYISSVMSVYLDIEQEVRSDHKMKVKTRLRLRVN